MKITKSKLREIILEEMERLNELQMTPKELKRKRKLSIKVYDKNMHLLTPAQFDRMKNKKMKVKYNEKSDYYQIQEKT